MNRVGAYRQFVNSEGEALAQGLRVALADGSFRSTGPQAAREWLEEHARERNPLCGVRTIRALAEYALGVWWSEAEGD